MVATRNINEVNVFMVWENYRGEITDKCLVATFINEEYALEFVKALNKQGDYNEFNHFDIRVNREGAEL